MIAQYDPGAYHIFRKGVHQANGKCIGWFEFLTYCFAWNEI